MVQTIGRHRLEVNLKHNAKLTSRQQGQLFIATAAFFAATSIPMSFFYYILPASLRQVGHAPDVVGLIMLVYLPYALRVIWAPLIDSYAQNIANRYRVVALASLACSVVFLLAMIRVDIFSNLTGLAILATAVFFCLSTGMTAIDGYCLMLLGEQGRNKFASFAMWGYSAGGVMVGVGAYFLADVSWQSLVWILVIGTFFTSLPALLLPSQIGVEGASESIISNDANSSDGLWAFFRKRETKTLVVVSCLIHGGLGLPLGYFPILLIDSGVTLGQIGLFGSVGGNVLGMLAALITGWLLVKIGGWRSIIISCIAGCICFAIFAGWAVLEHVPTVKDFFALGPVEVVTAYLVTVFLGSVFFILYRALVLIICNGSRAASQAAALSSFDFAIAIVSASMAGLVVESYGLTGLFLISAGLCLAGLFFSIFFKKYIYSHPEGLPAPDGQKEVSL